MNRERIQKIIGITTYIRLAKQVNDFRVWLKELLTLSKGSIDKTFDKPLVYISQPPRCGGTLTRNLFDGHTALAVYPYELSWEKNGYHFNSSLDHSNKSLKLLKDKWLSHAINHGFDKSIPFNFSKKNFKKLFHKQRGESQRAILNNYLTAFYNSWNNYSSPKNLKYNVAFCPWNEIQPQRVENFFKIYPDGFRLHIVRNPLAWWASEKSYDWREKNVKNYLKQRWLPSTIAGIELSKKFKEKYLLVNYENIVKNPRKTYQKLCDILEVEFEYAMLIPSINAVPRKANTSHSNDNYKVTASSLEKWKSKLSKEEITYIEHETHELFALAKTLCVN